MKQQVKPSQINNRIKPKWLNTLIKRQRLSDWIKKVTSFAYCLQDIHLSIKAQIIKMK